MSHRYHPDPDKNDDPESILFDDCLDCEDKAKRFGLELDPDRWSTLWRRMLVTEMVNYRRVLPNEKIGYTSVNEYNLCRQMYHMYLVLDRRSMDMTVFALTEPGATDRV
jgi:hypothetical protein